MRPSSLITECPLNGHPAHSAGATTSSMHSIKLHTILAFIFGALLFGSRFVFSFTEPTQTPPLNNVSAPLNIGSTGQSKTGGLILNTGGAANGLIVQSGKVGIGTANPSQTLHVVGEIMANVFYDQQSSGYYLDPNGYSNLYAVQPIYSFNGPIYDYNSGSYYLDPNGASRQSSVYADYLRSYGSGQVDGSFRAAGGLSAGAGTRIYLCPANANERCRAGCVGQLSLNSTCTNYQAFGEGCSAPGTHSCTFVGYLVTP